MNEEKDLTQMAPENIRVERERLSNLVYVQFHRIGGLIASPNNAIVINWGVRDSLDFIDALLIAYADDEYIIRAETIKQEMDQRIRVDKHYAQIEIPTSLMKFKPMILHDPRRYYTLCMLWLKEMNRLLQSSGFTEAGRGTYTFQERADASNSTGELETTT